MALLVSSIPILSIASPVRADAYVVDLEIGDGYDMPFEVENVKPGDAGLKVVMLRNAGNADGQVAIWISDLQETDGASDGAHLDDYLRLRVAAAELSTNINLPATIEQFPSGAFGDTYLRILNVRVGETIAVTWSWEFRENYQPQNEAQGDGLSFTIYYMLGVMPPPNVGMSWLEVDVLGQVTTALLDDDGRATEQVEALDLARSLSLKIPEGTACLSDTGTVVQRIEVSRAEASKPMSYGRAQIGPPYVVSAFDSNGSATTLLLDEPAVLRIEYDASLLPSVTIAIGLYKLVNGSWEALDTAVDEPSYIGQCAGLLYGSGEVAVIATFDPLQSAYFLSSDLEIELSEQTWWEPIIFASRVGDVIKVSVVLTNIGEVQGTRNITLDVDGVSVRTEQVVLDPLERREIVFELTGLTPGEHLLEVSGLGGEVEVGTHINWWMFMILFLLAIAAIIGLGYSAYREGKINERIAWLQGNVIDVESKLLESRMAIVAMRERYKNAVRSFTAAKKDRASHPPVNAPPQREVDTGVATAAVEEVFDPTGKALGMVGMPFTEPERSRSDRERTGAALKNLDEEAAPIAVEELQQQEDLQAKRVRVAKSFILAAIKERGQLTIDEVPKSRNAETVVQALSQLIEEGKISAVQKDHHVIFVLKG
jgi:hypothetical protein